MISEELAKREISRETPVNTIVDYLFEDNANDADGMIEVFNNQLLRNVE